MYSAQMTGFSHAQPLMITCALFATINTEGFDRMVWSTLFNIKVKIRNFNIDILCKYVIHHIFLSILQSIYTWIMWIHYVHIELIPPVNLNRHDFDERLYIKIMGKRQIELIEWFLRFWLKFNMLDRYINGLFSWIFLSTLISFYIKKADYRHQFILIKKKLPNGSRKSIPRHMTHFTDQWIFRIFIQLTVG